MAKLLVKKEGSARLVVEKENERVKKCWRLPDFDYARPYFYMVTLKRLEGLGPLSAIVAPGRCEMNAITKAFVYVIRHFHERVKGLEPIECFTIMPDHIHLLIKIAGKVEPKTFDFTSAGLTLTYYVETLSAALSRAYWEVCAKAGDVRARLVVEKGLAKRLAEKGLARHLVEKEALTKSFAIFSSDWHDWIVKCSDQLATWTRYIRENPERSWLRHSHRAYFRHMSEVDFLGCKWFGYGNAALLKLPVLVPMRYSRQIKEGSAEWDAALAQARRIGAGGAGIGTFMSPLEKACGRALGLAGGRWIVLSPEGFSERWHPSRQYERFCAEGRMLFLSLWAAEAREPTKAELYTRCHEMGDLIVEKLNIEKC